MPNSAGQVLATLWRWTVTTTEYSVLTVVSVVNALHFSYDNGAVPIALAFIFVGYGLIGVAVHEFGHAIAAWLVGWRVHLIVVWRLAFAPNSKQFHVFSGRRRQDFGGLVLATPELDADWDRGMVPLFLGGVAGNTALGILSIATAAIACEPESTPFVVLVWLGEISFIQAVANLVPVWRPGLWKNDGACLLAAIKGEGFTSREKLIMRLEGMRCDRVPVEDWDPIIRELLDADPPAYHESLDPLLLDYAFASADLPAARIIIERLLERGWSVDVEYRCTYAFITALLDQDTLRASEILGEVPEKLARSSFSYWRTHAVVEHLSGKGKQALKSAHRSREVAKRLGMELDDDEEKLLRAIERGEALPSFQPRPGSIPLTAFFEQQAARQERKPNGVG